MFNNSNNNNRKNDNPKHMFDVFTLFSDYGFLFSDNL
jgi:hypothetical protein